MKKIVLSITIFFLTLNATAHVEHYSKFNYLEYELFRNNKLIGYHKYNFERNKDFLKVKSYVEFNISKLCVNLYSYEAISEESYKNDKFFDFSSKTNQNKKKKYVNINDGMVIKFIQMYHGMHHQIYLPI